MRTLGSHPRKADRLTLHANMPYRFPQASASVFPVTTGQLGMMDDTTEELRHKLEDLRVEHRDLDDVITHLLDGSGFDQLQVKRLKKRKLMLKDEIQALESALVPDIIA